MFSATVPQKWDFVVQMHWSAFVDIVTLLFLSPKVILQQDRTSAHNLREQKVQSLFTVAEGISSCKYKTIQNLQALPCLSCFGGIFFSYILLTLSIYPKNVLCLSLPTQGFSSKPFTSPRSPKEVLFSLCRFFNSKDVCVTEKSCLFVLSSTQLSFQVAGETLISLSARTLCQVGSLIRLLGGAQSLAKLSHI